jgi:mRNA interferase MazF
MEFHRGDIHLVNFNPAKGGEIGKLRPAIILSQTMDNEILPTLIVIPLSYIIEKDALPYRYTITKREHLKHDSDACINEIRALSKKRIKDRIASLLGDEMQIIENALCSVLVVP